MGVRCVSGSLTTDVTWWRKCGRVGASYLVISAYYYSHVWRVTCDVAHAFIAPSHIGILLSRNGIPSLSWTVGVRNWWMVQRVALTQSITQSITHSFNQSLTQSRSIGGGRSKWSAVCEGIQTCELLVQSPTEFIRCRNYWDWTIASCSYPK